ncbi:MAG: L-glutamate gamma-semialdehyde dehydrogenase [Methylotenera sp.]|nr:L-glutamate gamma-semialdehyde dehydrogenase [Oligoflexia bacterium]
MSNAGYRVPSPINEPIRTYSPQGPDAHWRTSLKQRLEQMSKERIEIPCIIGGKEVFTGNKRKVVMPHSHQHVLAEFHLAGEKELKSAAQAALDAKGAWESMRWEERAAIFLKAADLLAGPFRDTLNAATMLGQSKNAFQAEIDSACELIDFLRFNAQFYQQIQQEQPLSSPGVWNRMEYRPLEGFVLAITPFNFTAIAANLPAAPAMLGNTVVWKPSDTQMLSAYYTMKLFEEAGLPPGVINFVPADGPLAGQVLLPMRELAGIHFTGSTATFQHLFKTVGENIANYRTYPRLVGETGGKDFVFVHPSADAQAVSTALLRGSFEYQGQKCSAASRGYIPKSLWPKIQDQLLSEIKALTVGDVRDFSHFMNAVIDERSFDKISGYLAHARTATQAKVIAGGSARKETGYFVDPTVILAQDPMYRSMVEEIFGPVLSLHVYDDNQLQETLKICDESSPYALTGAIFAQDRYALAQMSDRLRNAAGNFYINDKPTGAVVGQQPFGGARASGTNDKAGSALNLHRWLSPRTIKETFTPPKNYRYPFLDAK